MTLSLVSSRSLTDGPINLTWEATNNQPGDEGACLTAYSGGPAVDQVLELRQLGNVAVHVPFGRLHAPVTEQIGGDLDIFLRAHLRPEFMAGPVQA